MSATSLTEALQQLAGNRRPVVCVGDFMLDRFIYGQVSRISPEAPVPVLRVSHQDEMAGGAGNVVRNLQALGQQVRFLGVVGDDAAGAALQAQLASLGGAEGQLLVDGQRPTTLKHRYVAQSQQLLRTDYEDPRPVAATVQQALHTAFQHQLRGAGAVILSDYGKGVLTADLTRQFIQAARQAGLPVIVDPKGHDYSKYAGATVLCPNLKELAEATGRPVDNRDEMDMAARALMHKYDLESVLVTRGAHGMLLVTPSAAQSIAAQAREVFDVSGAGDTVVATLAAARAAGVELAASARLANAAAGLVVGKVGTATATVAELEDYLETHGSGERKAATLQQAMEQVQAWRRRGLKVGFTNGCFDLLHPGHIHLLAQAAARCDRLVVGLNSDASVRGLKGEGRPIQNELARRTVLSALANVDLIILFNEDTPLHLIETLRPDVLIKGADYTVAQVVGADVVQSYGGEVFLAELLDGHSTTRLVQKQ